MTDSLQDTFTRHFHRPPVPDPWQRLARLNLHYWEQRGSATRPHIPSCRSCRSCRPWRAGPCCGPAAPSPPSALAAAVGLLTAAAHPLVEQGDRLWILLWVPVALGVPFAVDLLRSAVAARRPTAAADEAAAGPGW
jgi:hypothetical protein